MITVECGLPISAACTADIITADIIRNVVSSSDDDIMVALTGRIGCHFVLLGTI